MRMLARGSWLVVLTLAVTACGGATTAPDEGACDPIQYPCGPYGYLPGTVVANLALTGRRSSAGGGVVLDAPVAPIQLADYFHDGSVRALVISIGAAWCVPCINEQPALNRLYETHLATGGHLAILGSIIQDQHGDPAQEEVADAWAKAYHTPFDIAVDPMQALRPFHDASFPVQMLIDTTTMTMTYYHVGGGADAQLEAAVARIVGP